MVVLKKIINQIYLNPSYTTLGLYTQRTSYHKDTCSAFFIVFLIARILNLPRYPTTEEGIKSVVYLHNAVLLS